ncbi:Na+/H+ antiporter [Fulvimarina pelagi HTCC2506]|uniref:Na+/H+ antiporter n=1 Tax=Fulvimarina pelagi HTCC2506 TaxID=314231 RepID=Q0G4U3_9HYPH|nr:cation:proton antiporter [Fulvimarina pelagi]EAU43321.1 Na+/H+ antiporter [Fulvimarina pelagi HTCC2506]
MIEEYAKLFYEYAVDFGLVLLGLSFLLTTVRIIIGPTLPDRVLGLDMLTSVSIGFIALIGINTGFTLYVDIAIALGLVGFLATTAFSRFILARGQSGDEDSLESLPFRDPQGKSSHGTRGEWGR